MSVVIHRQVIDLMKQNEIELDAFTIIRIEHVAGSIGAVEIWFTTGVDERTGTKAFHRKLRVIGTGQALRASEVLIATTSRSSDGLVWHLLLNGDTVTREVPGD